MARLVFYIKQKIKHFFLPTSVKPTNYITIGQNSIISNSKLKSKNTIGNNCFIANCSIGEFTYIAENSSIMNTEIGKFCSIARNVGIGLGQHPTHTFVSTHPAFFSPHKQCGYSFTNNSFFNETGQTVIGNDVWIGANVVIMDNVNVGDGAIIGAGAIVTKDIPPYAIVVGSPAKIIKYRFTLEQINFLLEFKWWNKNESWLEENFKDWHNIDNFFNKYKNANN